MIRSYSNYQVDPPISLQPLADYLASLSTDPPKDAKPEQLVVVKLAALEVLSSNGAMNTDKARAALLGMLGEKNPDVRISVIQAIEEARVTQAVPLLIEMLAKSDAKTEKLALVRALGALSEKDATWKALTPLLHNKETEPALRLETLRALGALDFRKAKKNAAELLADSDLQVQQEAVVLLGRDADGARLVGQRFLQNKLPRALLPLVAEVLRRFAKDNQDNARLLTDVMKGGLLVATSPQDVARIGELVKTQGNAKHGRELYLNNKALACINCHRLEGVGGSVGPDLTRVWDTHSLEKVMEAILDPSKEIKEGYQAYRAVTTSGQIVTGLRVSQNDKEVVLRDATGKEVRIAAKDLDELTVSKKSLMPDDVVKHLSFNEFLDLVAFLRDRAAQESLRGLALEFLVAGPLPPGVKVGPGLGKLVGTPAGITAGGMTYAWQPRQADPSGRLDVSGMFKRDDAVAYALTFGYSPKEQKVQMAVGRDLEVWTNDDKVLGSGTELPSGEWRHDAIGLVTGWNSVLLRMEATDQGRPPLSLRFIGGEGLRLSPRREVDIPVPK